MAKRKDGVSQVHMQNAVKTLAANIRFASVDSPAQSLVVTSSVPNEGKTTVAISLAQAIATGGKSVLLVECDMRRRSIANALGLHARSGLYAVLSGQASLTDAAVATGTRNMYFLDAEPRIPNPDALLSSKRFRSFHDTAVRTYDYVVFDTPPLSAFVDAAVLSTVANATVLVVGENIVRREELRASYAQLEKAGANVIGAVMNLCKAERNEYYTEYYEHSAEEQEAASAMPAPAPKPSKQPAPQVPRKAPSQQASVASAAATSRPASAAPAAAGLRPIPAGGTQGAVHTQSAAQAQRPKTSPGSTAQFIAQAKAHRS